MAVTLITGTSSGIGLASALYFARQGHVVAATLRDPCRAGPRVEAASSEWLRILPVELDVTDPGSIANALAGVRRELGPVDVLVNNAGIGGAAPLEEVPEDEHRAIFETNYWGAIRMIQGVLPEMRERHSGAIVNVSSMVGRVALVCQVPYVASKYALEGASESLAQEVAAHGIRVALVEPGVFQTQIWDNSAEATRYDRSSPYRSAMRRNGQLYRRLRAEAGNALRVAEVIFEAATARDPRLRYVVGSDAERLIAGRATISDEEWVSLCEESDDEAYDARFTRAFGFRPR